MLQKYAIKLLSVVVLTSACLCAQLAAGPYLQLSSSKDQLATPSTESMPMVIVMDNQDGGSGIGWNAQRNEITVKEDGVYFLMAVGQIGMRETATKLTKGSQIFLWFEINGIPVRDGSSSMQSTPIAHSKTIVNQMVSALKSGDTIRYKFTSSAAQFGLLSYPATDVMPASPGMTFTMYKVGI